MTGGFVDGIHVTINIAAPLGSVMGNTYMILTVRHQVTGTCIDPLASTIHPLSSTVDYYYDYVCVFGY